LFGFRLGNVGGVVSSPLQHGIMQFDKSCTLFVRDLQTFNTKRLAMVAPEINSFTDFLVCLLRSLPGKILLGPSWLPTCGSLQWDRWHRHLIALVPRPVKGVFQILGPLLGTAARHGNRSDLVKRRN
jgi:hypothetical protein